MCAPSQYFRQYEIPLANNFKAGLKGERVTFTLFLQHVLLQLLESQALDYSQHCSDDGKDFRFLGHTTYWDMCRKKEGFTLAFSGVPDECVLSASAPRMNSKWI